MKSYMKLCAACLLCLVAAGCSRYDYETVKGDPMGARIYTLDNGLKVYMSVNKQTPRIQTYIAVHAGGKNDPADNTGLAHYLEHIMFKGTPGFGTSDYEAEKPMIERIQALYDVYRTKTDPAEREAIYHEIDSVSYEASKLAIPNEYDKLMSLIGSEGSNAFTSEDVTCYQEDIPSNQVENWAKVQSDRFKNMVVRGFHTELEAVYEEKNRGLNNDGEKALEAVNAVLFPNHPYGTQTVIGTQDHLKNPSITAILKQKAAYYVPNNCAICVSGDFDPDEFVAIVEKYFGDWEPNPEVPVFEMPEDRPLASPVEMDVYGTESEFVMLSWKYPGAATVDSEIAEVAGSILYNGMAGLMDLDLNQQQKVLGAYGFTYGMSDYGEFIAEGLPQQGQSLEQVRDLILGEVARLRSGDFDPAILKAVVANMKLHRMNSLERNSLRAMLFVDSFINGTSWEWETSRMDRLEKLTPEDISAWASKYLGDNNYALVYKHIGEDKSIRKIEAPKITPIVTNRDKESAFLREVADSKVKPIEPVFVDYSKDMSVAEACGMELLYKHNDYNDLSSVSFVFDKGLLDNPALSMAFNYLGYLGTPTVSAEEFAVRMYSLACTWAPRVTDGSVRISVSGLDENIGEALDLVADLLANATPDEDVLAALIADELKGREDSKFSQGACRNALQTYLRYGPEYIAATTVPSAKLSSISSEELLSAVRELSGYVHTILYYGPSAMKDAKAMLEEHHKVAPNPLPLEKKHAGSRVIDAPEVLIAPYEARQFNYVQYSNRGEKFEIGQDAYIDLFNEYFGGGMNTIVFQEMRESRALAYSAGAWLATPSWADGVYSFSASIGSQNDKLRKAVEAFDGIINDMPLSDKAFDIARTAMEAKLRTSRTVGYSVLLSYMSDREMGVDVCRDRLVFEKLPSITLDDLKATQERWIKGRTYAYGILGDTSDLDMDFLRTLGPVKVLTLDEIFGY
ncbi:MAG: insulinase family protein [Bacteroidales bacterium]|nr:insulinase family protein [Bacteroidales bacterium]